MPQPKSPESGSASATQDNADQVEPATKSIEKPLNSILTDQQVDAIGSILSYVYNYRTEDGEDPSRIFHRKVNKRMVPDYYDIIKEPMAMSTIKHKINVNEYRSIEEFVRDWALICHNAQLYNSPQAQAYHDALTIKDIVGQQLQKLADKGIVTKDQIQFPFLGDIPPPDEMPAPVEEEEEDDDEDEDDEDVEDDSDDEGRKKRKRGRQSLAAKREKMEGKDKDMDEDPEMRKKRGRPPRVDTPLEARIKAVMKGLRRLRNSHNDLMVLAFERLPDKADEPGYYNQIKNPIALDGIKRKLKRKKYTSVDQFMRDVELMFQNAQAYNEDDSQIHQDSLSLQQEARRLAEIEKKKPDSEFTLEDGRIPLPEGILHNGELWKVGDWVHIQNANDMTKPIVAQIYRTWQDQDGSHWVNACWYYRPEQTVHRFDRHFFDNEVVKTGQYRDHPIDEIVDRCFVMFFTRYNKGRPRNFPRDKEVYVCECRYNEEKHKHNKIKTWASCLPDEVRDKDYEMDLFDAPRKLKKVPSPIAYLFKEGEQKETDDLPKPVWGAPNAPPKIGAVHCRPRDPKDSPPPEPTPTPPPQPPPQPVRQISSHQVNGMGNDRPNHINIAAANTPRHPMNAATTSQSMQTPGGTYTPGIAAHPSNYHPSPSPAPAHPQLHHSNSYGSHHNQSYSHQSQQQHSTGYNSASQQHGARTNQGPTAAYRTPNPVDVWHLPDSANASIPEDIRAQFQQDDQGRVLFFTTPPAPPSQEKKPLRHTPTYLAWRARQAKDQSESKKRTIDQQATIGAEKINIMKRSRSTPQLEISEAEIKNKAAEAISDMLLSGLMSQLRADHGEEGAKQALETHFQILQNFHASKAREDANRRSTELGQKEQNNIRMGLTQSLDYKPPNEHLEWPTRA